MRSAAAPRQPDPKRRVVVRVVELLEALIRVRAVDEEVDAGRDAAKLEVLAVEMGGIEIGEPDRGALLDGFQPKRDRP